MTTLTRKPLETAQVKRPNLERQAILFTVGLYLFICAALLAVHYLVPAPPPVPEPGSSSTSPYNP